MDVIAAGLNIRDNSKNVSYESYVLSITAFVLTLLSLLMYKNKTTQYLINSQYNKYILYIMIILVVCFCIINMVYYTDNKKIDDNFYNYSIAHIVISLTYLLYVYYPLFYQLFNRILFRV